MAVDQLKIDQSFVRGLHRDRADEAIVSTVISLARKLGLRTVAEGVESAEQLEFLRDNGCDEAQGYLLGMPLTLEEFAALLSKAANSPAATGRLK
jgi:EAL domain-containing protein (putative c-di-GMP-specific phosphodiesterase class I)